MKNALDLLRTAAAALSILLGAATAATAQTSIGIGISTPGLSIGINMPAYPEFVRVPNYPVYYAPRQQNNFFFYDGMYWVYQQDNWYASSWYDGPWYGVAPQAVPLFVLRIPVRYYRNPPSYFRGWRPDAPPRWGDHWGNDWSRQRSGWDRWDRRAAPAPAPLPTYQRQYSGDRYPRVEQEQRTLQTRNYRYQPRDASVRQQVRQQPAAAATAPPQRMPQARPAAPERAQPMQQGAERRQPSERTQPPQPGAERRQPPAPNANGRDTRPARAEAPRPAPGQGRGPDQDRSDARGKGKGQDKDRDNGDEAAPQRKK